MRSAAKLDSLAKFPRHVASPDSTPVNSISNKFIYVKFFYTRARRLSAINAIITYRIAQALSTSCLLRSESTLSSVTIMLRFKNYYYPFLPRHYVNVYGLMDIATENTIKNNEWIGVSKYPLIIVILHTNSFPHMYCLFLICTCTHMCVCLASSQSFIRFN